MPTGSEIVLRALVAVTSGDEEAAAEVVDPQFVWHIPGHSAVGGDAVGVGGWTAKLRRLVAAGLQPQMLGILEGGDHVAVLQRNVAQAGDLSLDVRVVNLFTIGDGKVTRLETFFADQHAVEHFWNEALRNDS